MDPALWMHNPATGELAHLLVAPAATGGLRMDADLWLQPGAAVLGEHTHAALTERFDVLEGRIGYRLDGVEGVARAGESIEIPVGARHDWWNAGDARARAHFSLESADRAHPMAGRFLAMIETAWGLAASDRTGDDGVPGALWLVALAHEYLDVLQLTSPPPAVQRVVVGALARLARALGRDARAPWLHGAQCPARVPAPDEDVFASVLATRAPAGAAR